MRRRLSLTAALVLLLSLLCACAAQHAQEMDENVTSAHIKTFVTDFSLDLGPAGRAAIETLVGRAAAFMGKTLPSEGLFLR